MIALARRFAFFWWDFIVGDSIALAVGSCTALIIGASIATVADRGPVEFVLPLLVVLTLSLSLRRS